MAKALACMPHATLNRPRKLLSRRCSRSRRNYWRGTSWTVWIQAAVYSSDNPPIAGQPSLDKTIHSRKVEIDSNS
jgi:hypothetical protein